VNLATFGVRVKRSHHITAIPAAQPPAHAGATGRGDDVAYGLAAACATAAVTFTEQPARPAGGGR
jgi:hypothetical protein